MIAAPFMPILGAEEKKDAAPVGGSGSVDDSVSFGVAEREAPTQIVSQSVNFVELSPFTVVLPSADATCYSQLDALWWFCAPSEVRARSGFSTAVTPATASVGTAQDAMQVCFLIVLQLDLLMRFLITMRFAKLVFYVKQSLIIVWPLLFSLVVRLVYRRCFFECAC